MTIPFSKEIMAEIGTSRGAAKFPTIGFFYMVGLDLPAFCMILSYLIEISFLVNISGNQCERFMWINHFNDCIF